MTEPSTKPTKLATPSRPRAATSAVRPILVLIFRLLLLGVGSALALLLGIAIAQVAPGAGNERPVLEDLLRGVARLRGVPYPDAETSPLPREVSGPVGGEAGQRSDDFETSDFETPNAAASPNVPEGNFPEAPAQSGSARARPADEGPTESSPTELRPAEPDSTTAAQPSPTEPSPAEPSPPAQQALRQELTQLRSEQRALEEAIAQLEAQIGIAPASGSLDARIAAIERQLAEGNQGTAQPAPRATPQNVPQTTPQRAPQGTTQN